MLFAAHGAPERDYEGFYLNPRDDTRKMRFLNGHYRSAISKTASIGIVVILVVAAVIGVYYASTYHSSTTTTTTSPTTTTTPTSFTLSPTNSSVLVDESQIAPDYLDPGVAFFSQDSGYLNAVFQSLVAYNGTNSDTNQILPVIASSWTVTNNSEEYTFTIRPDVHFSNGVNVTAYDVWFSFVREIYINAPSGVAPSNYNLLTERDSAAATPDVFTSACGDTEPWGLIDAVSASTKLSVPTSANDTAPCAGLANFLNNMLSNFNPSNTTQLNVMSYSNQAYSAPNSSTFVVKLYQPYLPFLQDLAGFSGSEIVDPAAIDAHPNTNGLAVQNNTLNSYADDEGTLGTGPYVVKSVSGVPASEIVLVKNKDYWASTKSGALAAGLPWLLAPAKIPEIDMKYAPPTTQLYEDFGTNVAQITASNPGGSAGLTQWSELWADYNYKAYFTLSDVVRNYGGSDFAAYLGLNSQRFPTNITDFRLAVTYAMNYSQLAKTEIEYNGSSYGSLMVGPSAPDYGYPLYNPLNYSNPTQNIPLALKYIAEAGDQAHFYVVLPNGTALGDTNGSPLPTIDLDYLVPLTSATETQLDIYVSSLAQIGVVAAPYGITSGYYDTLSASPSTAPNFVNIFWGLDFPDPFLEQYVCFYTTSCGIASYVNNSTLTALVDSSVYSTNSTYRLQVVKELYKISAQEAYYVWLPYDDNILWVQPYVQGIYYNPYVGYWYNLMYYVPAHSNK